MPTYKVAALEVDSTEQAYATEILMSAANTVFPSTAYVPATNAQDAINLAAKIVYSSVTTTTSRNTSSGSFVNDSTLTTGVTPIAGTYLVIYAADGSVSPGLLSSAHGEIAIYSGGALVAESVRGVGGGGTPHSGPTALAILTLNGSTTVQPRFRLTSGNNMNLHGASSFTLLRLSFT